MKMKELPEMERPYEKLEANGAESLSTAELLAIVIKSGTKDKTSLEIAQGLLLEDTEDKGICFLNDLSLEELMQRKGIGRSKAILIKAVCELGNRFVRPDRIIRKKLSSPEEVFKILEPGFKNKKKEIIKTVLLDYQNRVIKVVENAVGSANTSYVEIKEIMKEPIRCGASKIVVSHNHPSGDASPSEDDIVFTKKVRDAGVLLGISVIDHVIIGNNEFYSFRRMKKF